MSILTAVVLSLLLTVLLEFLFALLYGVPRDAWKAILVANCISNPIAVLLYETAGAAFPTSEAVVLLAVEISVIVGEGLCYWKQDRIPYPWEFSLLANVFSFCCGQVLLIFFR